MKLWRNWFIVIILIFVALVSYHFSETVYNGREGNLSLSRWLFNLFWILISLAFGMEGLILARFLSKVRDKNISATWFVVTFLILALVGFSPIGLMSVIGLPIILLISIFTLALLLITGIESFRTRHRKFE